MTMTIYSFADWESSSSKQNTRRKNINYSQVIEKNEKNTGWCCLSGRGCEMSGFDVAAKDEQKYEEIVQKSSKKW